MFSEWFAFLKGGLSRRLPDDRISGHIGASGFKAKLENLRPFIFKHWKRGLLGAVLIIFSSLIALPRPLIIRYLTDDVIIGRQVDFIAVAILLLGGTFFAEKIMGLLKEYFFASLERDVLLDIQQGLIERVLRFPKSFFDQIETGYLMSRLSSDVEGLQWFFSGTIVYIIQSFMLLFGAAGLLFYLEWRLAIGVLISVPGLIITVRYFSRKIHILSWQGMEQEANVLSRFQESLSSFPLIKAFSSEDRTLRRLMSGLRDFFQISLEQTTVNSVAELAISSLAGIARASVLALGAYWVIMGEWTLGSLFAFYFYLGYVFGSAEFLSTTNLPLQNARSALERVSALFDILPEENMGTGKKVEHLKGEVEFKDVSFSYNGCDPVLRDVCFHINPGEHVSIVGPSGVGKTTLLSLVLRFYRPTSGEVYFDGMPASDYEVSSLRKRIGYVSQNIILLSGTIMENLRYGNPEVSIEEVFKAAKAAEIDDFINSLPEGYETRLSEKGINLSEGQRQRLSIARAIVKDPDMLILDDPTSALDSITEMSILHILPSIVKDKTLFLVTQSFSTIKDSSQVLFLNDESLTVGTHRSLMETNEFYRSLVRACE